jgi:hypothetical protein
MSDSVGDMETRILFFNICRLGEGEFDIQNFYEG